MIIKRPMFPPRADEPLDFKTDIPPEARFQNLSRNTGDRELVAALLGFTAWGLQWCTLDEMRAMVLDDLERARQLAEKNRRQTLRRSQLKLSEVQP
jgi:hypothetical protein